MAKINPEAVEIAKYISIFIDDYAPAHLTSSEHTLRSYDTALTYYIGYLDERGIKPSAFSAKSFEHRLIEDWLKWLAEERNCSPETCNNRLASLRVFIKYLSSRDTKYLYLLNDSKTVPLRDTKKKKVYGLTRNAVKVLLESPDLTSKSGVRDETLMVLLYGTAARLDEVLSMKVKDLHLNVSKPYVIVSGKGNVIRTLYLLPKAVDHLKNYLEIFHGLNPIPESYIFYSRNKGISGKLSQAAVRKMLRKYAAIAHEVNSDVPLDLHAHQFRHARASHWLEDGINIVQISKLLGHAHLETTMIYLDITTEQEAEALATLQDENIKNTVPKWNPEKDTLASICGMRKIKQKK